MTSSRERKERICLNCQASLHGRYCHMCGQENREPRESAGELIAHFLKDFTHYDSTFFRSVRTLFWRPGLMPLLYIQGKRASYLNPVRMYIFTSAVFFLIFYNLYTPKDDAVGEWTDQATEEFQWQHWREKAYREARTKGDSLTIDSLFIRMYAGIVPSEKNMDTGHTDGLPPERRPLVLMDSDAFLAYRSRAQYDSAQSQLSPVQRDGWLKRQLTYQQIHLSQKYSGNTKQMLLNLGDRFIHMFPYLLFISLPLFALFLKMIYLRHARYYFVDHLIFLLYLYIFTFLFLLLFFALNAIADRTGWSVINWIQFFFSLYGIYYAYRAMRNFYEQGRKKTIFKFILLNTLASVILLILFIFFLGISFFQI